MCGQGMMVRGTPSRRSAAAVPLPHRRLRNEDGQLLKRFQVRLLPVCRHLYGRGRKTRRAWQRRLRWVMGFTQCDHKYKKSVQKAMREKKYPFFAWYDTFFGIVPPVIFIVATMLASLAGLVLTIVYASMGSLLWGKALLLLMLMPPLLMYLLDLLYNALTMYIYRDAYAVLSRGEKAATLLFSPLFMFEYFPVFLHAHLYLLTESSSDGRTRRGSPTRRAPPPKERTILPRRQEILHQAQKSGAPRRGQHRQRIKTRAGSPGSFVLPRNKRRNAPRLSLGKHPPHKGERMPSTRCMPLPKSRGLPPRILELGAPILFRRLFAVRKGQRSYLHRRAE